MKKEVDWKGNMRRFGVYSKLCFVKVFKILACE